MFSPAAAMTNEPWGGQVHPAFDVIAHSTLNSRAPANRYGYEGRGHLLWYCDPFEEERFGWFEVAFMHNPFLQQTSSVVPFALPPGPDAAGRLAAASMGEWNQPSSMPETTIPRNWRS
jgi:serine/threonine-protein kinase